MASGDDRVPSQALISWSVEVHPALQDVMHGKWVSMPSHDETIVSVPDCRPVAVVLRRAWIRYAGH